MRALEEFPMWVALADRALSFGELMEKPAAMQAS